MTIRHLARAATLQTVAEERLALANQTKPQQLETEKFAIDDLVDLYRQPSPKDAPGWRGPAQLLDLDEEQGICTVKWQGRSYTIPLRHVRKHQGLFVLQLCTMNAYFQTAALPDMPTLMVSCVLGDGKIERSTAKTSLLSQKLGTCYESCDTLAQDLSHLTLQQAHSVHDENR